MMEEPKQEEQIDPRRYRDSAARELGKQLKQATCPDCSLSKAPTYLIPVKGKEAVFDCPECGLTGVVVVQHTKHEKDFVSPEDEPGTFTPEMVNYLLCRLLDDVGGVKVAGEFFKNIPVDTGWEAQYDEVNDVWRFFVRTQRKRKSIYRPTRKVITNG